MVNGRNKGAAFERQMAKMLLDELGISFKRDLEQYRAGDHGDLIADDPAFPFVIECKRYAEGTGLRPGWWAQAQAAAEAAKKIPAVIYKYDRRDIRVAIPLGAVFDDTDGHVVEMDVSAFCYMVREIMNGDEDGV